MRPLLTIALMLVLAGDDLAAAYFRDDGFLADQGVLETLTIEPRMPVVGEPFKVLISGSWPEKNSSGLCFPAPPIDKVVVYERFVQVVSNLDHNPDLCGQPPAQWNLEADIPADAWAAVNEDGYLLIEHLLHSGINMLTGINQRFDLRLGTHEVPAYLAAGYWISPDRPFEGIMIEQQGTRVLFYELAYDRDTDRGDEGEPVWILDTGEMHGNSVLARAYRYDWQFTSNGQPVTHPEHDDIFTANESGAIIVNDYNHVRAFGQRTSVLGRYADYHRFVFGLDSSRTPVYVPPLGGQWTLVGFDDRTIAFTADLNLMEGVSAGPDAYVFSSLGGDWSVRCHVTPPGEGDCRFEHNPDGVRFDFPLTAFQGNLARGSLILGGGEALEGILVRHPYSLPVMDPIP